MAAKQYTLWGHHPRSRALPEPYPVRITGGNLRHCRSERDVYVELGWIVGIYATTDMPMGLRDRVVAAQPDPARARARLAELAVGDMAWLGAP